MAIRTFFDDEFFAGEFFNPAIPADLSGGSAGGGGGAVNLGEESPTLPRIFMEITEPADRFRGQRERGARLREQLRVALEGPQAAAVRALVEPQPVDATEALHERVDIEALAQSVVAQVQGYYRAAIEAREREIDADDDEVLMLL